jgi:hypothetical protein
MHAQYITNTGHTYGTINDTSEVLYIEKKSQLLNTIQRFYKYNLSKQKQQMNETYADTHNPIFDLIISTL